MKTNTKKKVKTTKAWAVVSRGVLTYGGGILDTYATFQTRKHANAFAIACYRAKLDELSKYVVPCTITYSL